MGRWNKVHITFQIIRHIYKIFHKFKLWPLLFEFIFSDFFFFFNLLIYSCNVSFIDPWWLVVTVTMTGKFFITISFGIIYIYSSELFPTVVRNIGMGSASVCGRIGTIIAPFMRELVSLKCINFRQICYFTRIHRIE